METRALRVARYTFLLNVVFLILHEMDAVYWREWRLFGLTDDAVGRVVFLLVHIPMFLLLVSGVLHLNTVFGRVVSGTMGGFLIVHFFLHRAAFAENLFNETTSFGIITAMLVISVVQLAATIRLSV